jgi:hypothetical protein
MVKSQAKAKAHKGTNKYACTREREIGIYVQVGFDYFSEQILIFQAVTRPLPLAHDI